MKFELSLVELAAESAVVLPSRSLLRHRSSTKVQQMNNIALANAVGVGATAAAVNLSIANTQNMQKFSL